MSWLPYSTPKNYVPRWLPQQTLKGVPELVMFGDPPLLEELLLVILTPASPT